MPKATPAALARHIKLCPPVEVEIDDDTDPRKPIRRNAKLVFTTNALNPMHRATWSQYWAPARDAADIPKGVGLHCLREWPEAHEKTRAIVDSVLGDVPRMCPPKAAGR